MVEWLPRLVTSTEVLTPAYMTTSFPTTSECTAISPLPLFPVENRL
jgi:hypothetical protein